MAKYVYTILYVRRINLATLFSYFFQDINSTLNGTFLRHCYTNRMRKNFRFYTLITTFISKFCISSVQAIYLNPVRENDENRNTLCNNLLFFSPCFV